jgi:DNA invertase Pin-like site-specific DNA recombinase
MIFSNIRVKLAIILSRTKEKEMKIGYIGRLPKPDNSSLKEQLFELKEYNCDSYEEEKEECSSFETTLLFETINNRNKGDEILICAFKYIARDKADLKKILRHTEDKGVSLVLTGGEMSPSNILQAYDDFNSYIHSYRIRNTDSPKQDEWKKGVRSMARSRLEQRDVYTKKYDDEVKKIITLITEDAAVRKRRAGRPREVAEKDVIHIKNDLFKGLSVKDIAKERGVSTRTIYRIIKQHKLKRGE